MTAEHREEYVGLESGSMRAESVVNTVPKTLSISLTVCGSYV